MFNKNIAQINIKIVSINIIIFFIFFFILQNALTAQIIEGTITDSKSKIKLSNAHILIPEASTATTTNEEGYFKIKLEQGGTYKILFTYVGFADTSFVLKLGDNEVIQLDIPLKPLAVVLDSVFITALRYVQKNKEIPSRIAIINKDVIENSPHNNTDEFLLMIPGVHTDRDFGIFSRNAGVTMRGMNSTARVLVLLNGTPLNKADGGGINWNRIVPEQVEHIEIVKGPASTIYGGNAMAGIINIITPKPKEKLAASLKTSIGTYDTYALNTNLSGNNIKNEKGIYWSLNNFLRKGKGYLVNTADLTTDYDTTVFINEIGADGTIGVQFNKNSEVEFSYHFWDDVRGEGVKVYEELGTYSSYKTQHAKISFGQHWGKALLRIQPFYHLENYLRQNESVGRKNNKYRYYDTRSYREDYGILTSLSAPINNRWFITGGIDAKQGKVLSEEIYYTSTDLTKKTGQLNQYALYMLGQANYLNDKLNISTGVRYDYIQFRNGSFEIETPSALTAFIENYPIDFTDENWGAISPKLSARYHFNSKFSSYLSYAIGYRPPMLDDMCTNRNITKGFKIANSKLAPEYLYNYETGFDWMIHDKMKLETSIYHSVGKGFHYFVGTGDSVDTGGDALKAVLIRDNIAEVKIWGIENSLNINVFKNLFWNLNHAYNHSIISEFKNEKYENKELSGKFLMEVPAHTFNTAIQYNTKYLTTTLSFHYVGKQWADDENTMFTPAYQYINLKFTSKPIKMLVFGLGIQNILNEQYVNNKGQLCPGRFIMFYCRYLFTLK